ncbi:MAG: hypothetical protein ACPLRU_06155 [Desulfofundulus sp.]
MYILLISIDKDGENVGVVIEFAESFGISGLFLANIGKPKGILPINVEYYQKNQRWSLPVFAGAERCRI